MAKATRFLYHKLREELSNKVISNFKIPLSIHQNLNPKFELRPYQNEAFQHFMAFMEGEHNFRKAHTHLLFQMATGSGKTLMIAGLLLYLYERGYRNFLFFVNSTTILEKTKDNFLNGASSKYLFAPQIRIGGRYVNIVQANNFEGDNEDDICIVFDTIQGLHKKLSETREESLTMDDFQEKKIVMIADEAHHLSAETKKGTQLSLVENDDAASSWEGTVTKILSSNGENILLDFTATADLDNENIAAKYVDKLITDYSLKEFRVDGYSKEIEIFKSDSNLMTRALQAVLLSHYRKKLFGDIGCDIKPVILFKSKNITPSKEFMTAFVEKIQTLNISDIEQIKATNNEGILRKMFDYFEEKKLDFQDLIAELQVDFSKERCISANNNEEATKLQIQLNTLESSENLIRAVFAVDKLNEGWDVLNLFDIVRLYETRDSGKGKIGKTTAAEAQLVGRGARYCPFPFEYLPKNKRKFDGDLDSAYRVCETLYFHSNNDSRYISEITAALVQTGMIEPMSVKIHLGLKPSFQASTLYKNGLIFLNEQQEVKPLELELQKGIQRKIHEVDLTSGKTVTKKVFNEDGTPITTDDSNISKKVKVIKMRDFGRHIIRKALHQTEGLEFNYLKSKFEHLKSLNEFVTSNEYLAGIEIHLKSDKSDLDDFLPNEKLHIAKQVLKNLNLTDNTEEKHFIGTKVFKALPLRAVLKEKTVSYSAADYEGWRGMGNHANLISYGDKDILTADWYAFTDCYGTSEEKALVKFMKAKYSELKANFDEFYLVRNERHFALYDFAKGRRFEPDFVLFLKKMNGKVAKHYQIFIEPKGEHLTAKDSWKEEFLVRLRNEADIQKTALNGEKEVNSLIKSLWENDEFTVWGLPFYGEHGITKVKFNDEFIKIVQT